VIPLRFVQKISCLKISRPDGNDPKAMWDISMVRRYFRTAEVTPTKIPQLQIFTNYLLNKREGVLLVAYLTAILPVSRAYLVSSRLLKKRLNCRLY
jgi:hypothetical protein